jgi:uncharacterized protein
MKFPDAVLAQHIAVLGKTGSGKTSTAKLAVEQVAAQDFRVCVLDPVKSDWWGLTSSADGKRPGLPFKILGGPHGHVPLHSSAGKVIGKLVGSGELPLSIIDMADFEAGGLQRFFVDFAQALWKNAHGVVYLVIEEAHEFAPKERAGFGAENMAIHWAKRLATGGRTKGVRLIVATQRIQALHNAVLGACDTLIAHRIMAPADQEPVNKWLRANVKDKAKREEVEGSLSSLPTGTGWLCSGEAQIFKKIAFPRIMTFDNTATPIGDTPAAAGIITAPVDVDELRGLIGEAVELAEADDPKVLKAKIAALTEQIATLSRRAFDAGTSPVVQQALRDAHLAGFQEAMATTDQAMARLEKLYDDFREAFGPVRMEMDALARAGSAFAAGLSEVIKRTEAGPAIDNLAKLPKLRETWPNTIQGGYSAPAGGERPAPPRTGSGVTSFPPPINRSENGSGLTPALQRVLDAVAWWRKLGVEPVPRARAAVVAGYSPRASTFHGYVANLVGRAPPLIEVLPGAIRLTDAGLALANTPAAATAAELRAMAAGLLGPQQRRVFDAVYRAYPKPITRKGVAAAVGLSDIASTVHGYIADVVGYGIIETAGRGEVKAADWLFP